MTHSIEPRDRISVKRIIQVFLLNEPKWRHPSKQVLKAPAKNSYNTDSWGIGSAPGLLSGKAPSFTCR